MLRRRPTLELQPCRNYGTLELATSVTDMLTDFFKLNKAAHIVEFANGADFKSFFQHSKSLQHASLAAGIEITEHGFKDLKLENVRLSKVTFDRVTFTRCTFVDCLLIGTKFIDCEFHDCVFENCNTHKIVFQHVYIDPNSFKLDPAYRKRISNIGVYLFQELLRNSSETCQTYFAASADISFRRWKRYQLVYELGQKHSSRISTIWKIATNMLFDATAKYGYGPIRFLLLSTIVFAALSFVGQILWPLMGMSAYGKVSTSNITFLDSIYYCMLLVTTLGFSEIFPASAVGKAFAIGCGIFGISWMGLFTAILVRRVIR
jgi:hypothetical protein